MKVFEAGVNVSLKLDIGFIPYMHYLESLNGRNPAFGTKDNSSVEIGMWAKVQIGEDEAVRDVLEGLGEELEQIVADQLHRSYPDSFDREIPEPDYTFTSKTVVIEPEGDF